MPQIQWDCRISFAYRLYNLKEVILHNYRMVQEQEDRESCMIEVEFQFGEINHDHIQITDPREGNFVPLNREVKDAEDFWSGGESIIFTIDYDEVEDFIDEIKTQME